MTERPKSDHDEYPKTLPRDDYWGQVRRTINGRRISEDEVGQVVAALRAELELEADDVLLDLACGNGALSSRLFGDCRGVLGVDSSAYLIEIAREAFADPPAYAFVEGDVVDYVRSEPDPGRFTKALCYGSMMFLSVQQLTAMLTELARRFPAVRRLTLGNVPDRDRAPMFLARNPQITSLDLDDPAAQAGVWWSAEELEALGRRCGWAQARCDRLPPELFNAGYRFDLTLLRRSAA